MEKAKEITQLIEKSIKDMKKFKEPKKDESLPLRRAGKKMYQAYIKLLELITKKEIKTRNEAETETVNLRDSQMRELFNAVYYLNTIFYEGEGGRLIKMRLRESAKAIKQIMKEYQSGKRRIILKKRIIIWGVKKKMWVKTLLDTGSVKSSIKQDLVKKLGFKELKGKIFAQIMFDRMKFPVRLAIVKNINEKITLGADFLKSGGIKLDYKNHKITSVKWLYGSKKKRYRGYRL